MKNDDPRDMNLDQQINSYEERISLLEDCIRSGSGDPSRINAELDHAYRQVALLKIRKMMDFNG